MSRRKPLNRALLSQIGARIRFLRFERGLSQRKLAMLAECSIGNLCLLESGRSCSTVNTLRKIARALRVELFDILNTDTHDDDVGYLVEAMRHDKRLVHDVRSQMAPFPSG